MKQKREVDVELVTKAKGKVDYPSMLVRKATVPMSIWLAKYTNINPNSITYLGVFIMLISLFLLGYSGYSSNPFLYRLIGASLIYNARAVGKQSLIILPLSMAAFFNGYLSRKS